MKPSEVPEELIDLAMTGAKPGCRGDAAFYLANVLPAIAAELPAHDRQIRGQVAAEYRAAAQAIEDSDGMNDDPLTDALWVGAEKRKLLNVVDMPTALAALAYRHLADRIAQDEPAGDRLALITADDLAELLDYIVGGDDVRVVQDATITRAFAALKATLPRGEVQ